MISNKTNSKAKEKINKMEIDEEEEDEDEDMIDENNFYDQEYKSEFYSRINILKNILTVSNFYTS